MAVVIRGKQFNTLGRDQEAAIEELKLLISESESDAISTAAVTVTGDITGTAEANHNVTVAASSTAATAGGNLAVSGGAGATSGAGGVASVTGGAGGATGTGGAVTITSGAGGATSGNSGAVTIKSANETGTDSSGNVAISTGTTATANSGTIAIASGAATTGNSGTASFGSGAATTGDSGAVTIAAGAATTGTGGAVNITAGNGSVAGGNVRITAGASAGTDGVVVFNVNGADAMSINASAHLVPAGDNASDLGTSAVGFRYSYAKTPVSAVTADGAITIPTHNKTFHITKAGVAAMTLADPTATTHDGLRLRFMSTTAQAHTLSNAAGSGFNNGGAGADVGTFGGAIGDNIEIEAYQGKWYVVSKVNVTLA